MGRLASLGPIHAVKEPVGQVFSDADVICPGMFEEQMAVAIVPVITRLLIIGLHMQLR